MRIKNNNIEKYIIIIIMNKMRIMRMMMIKKKHKYIKNLNIFYHMMKKIEYRCMRIYVMNFQDIK